MDNNIKETIDGIFQRYGEKFGTKEATAICIDLYHDKDYGTIARHCDWEEYIGDISYDQKMSKAPKEFKEHIMFVNLGLDQEAEDYDEKEEEQMINDISALRSNIAKMVHWETEDFNGDVNQYWFAMVCVTRDYKVIEILTDQSSAIYEKMMADLSKMGSVDNEEEKLALASIQTAVSSIMTEFKKVKSDEGKSKVYGMVEDLDRMISRG